MEHHRERMVPGLRFSSVQAAATFLLGHFYDDGTDGSVAWRTVELGGVRDRRRPLSGRPSISGWSWILGRWPLVGQGGHCGKHCSCPPPLLFHYPIGILFPSRRIL